MKISEFKTFLKTAILKKKRVLAVSIPGLGKTESVKDVAAELDKEVKGGCDLILMHPAISDPTDFKGMPALMKTGKEAAFVPFGDLVELRDAKRLTICFIDDIGQAPQGVQAPLMQLLHGRKLNGHTISEDVVFVGATNDVTHGAGVSGLIEPLKSRWDTIIEITFDDNDFAKWLLDKDFPPECAAYVRSYPQKICQFKPSKDMKNSPCPRTVTAMFSWYKDGIKDPEVFAGAVGQGLATEFSAFLRLFNDLPSLDKILLNPDTTPIPDRADLRYAVAGGLAHRVDEHNFERALRYIERISEKKYEALFAKDALAKNTKVAQSKAFQNWSIKNNGLIL